MQPVKLPVLLSPDLRAEKPLPASSLSVTVSLRDKSTASLTVPSGKTAIPIRSFIRIYTHKGFLGVFRATTLAIKTLTGNTYTLTHAIDTLRDGVYKAQTTFEGTRQAFFEALLNQQEQIYWKLGAVSGGETPCKIPNINYTNLSDLFFKFFQDNPDLHPDYDFSTTPWTVNIKSLSDETGKRRFSLTRNAESCDIVYDDKQQATLLYLAVNTPEQVNGITKYNTELKTYTDAEGVAQYGIIEKTASIKTEEITGTPDEWAQAFFEKYMHPSVQITVDGYELYKQTGEIYDETSVGKRAVVSLPDFGVTTAQRIESVQYPDVLNTPTAVVVSLATKQKTFTAAISNLEKEVDKVGGVAGGAALSAADAEEVTAWSLIMQKVQEAVDGTGITTLWESGIVVDAEAGTTIYSLEQGFVSAFAALKVNSEQIELAVKQGQDNAAAIKVNADEIALRVTQTDFNALGDRVSDAEAAITVNADEIALRVTKTDFNALGTRVSNAESAIELNADEIELRVTKTDFNALGTRVSNAESAIELNADEIELRVTKTDFNALGDRVTAAESQIIINADGIQTKVSKDGVISSINQSAESVKISASKIVLDGLVTASELQAAKAEIAAATLTGVTTNVLSAQDANIQYLAATSFQMGGTLMSKKPISMGPISTGSVLSVSTASLDLAHSHEVSVSEDGTVTLGAVAVTGGNFNLADTKFYQERVSAAKQSVREGVVLTNTTGWQNGIFTVSALNANGQTYAVSLPAFSVSGGTSFNENHQTRVYFFTPSVTTSLASALVDASSVYAEGYNAGWAAAAAIFSMEWSGSGNYKNILTIGHAGDTPESESVSETIKITVSATQSAITSVAQNTLFASCAARAYANVNDEGAIQRAFDNDDVTATGNLGA